MKTAKSPRLVTFGAARHLTRAVGGGERMELIPTLFYDEAGGEADIVSLGSARKETRAIDVGPQVELIPTLRWTPEA